MSSEAIIKQYSNGEITVIWQPAKCSHSTLCFQHLPSVFDPRTRPWVNPQGASTEAIIAQIKTCPSGALSYQDMRSSASTETATKPSVLIDVRPNGPLLVQGSITLKAKDGSETVKEKVALCRCGASANKPFCDGSHVKLGFQDA
ncbi:(4Fe-4S)-binding protein [Thiolinea disciformis]|uniref:(4Fe-4S)-binding protein n=1 Tax=Thiolinea disciformis TaxID=125614 RepID=UPI00036445AD|nr:(4Fe-4S)-binding protein [Thiolinea disciformis]